jgi:hypothetical protein
VRAGDDETLAIRAPVSEVRDINGESLPKLAYR